MLLVTDLVNVRWLTGFTGSNAAAVVGRDGSRRFVTDFRYLTQSAEQVDPAWEREIAVDLLAGVVKGLPGSGELRLAFDDAHMSVKDHGRLAGMLRAGIELVPAGGAIEALRAVKDADELDAHPRRRAAGRRRADRGPRARARRAAPSARSRSTSSSRCAAWAPRPRRSRRSSPPASTARCRTPTPRDVADPGRHAVRRRLGRAARRLRLGLHAHVRDRRARPARRARSTRSCSHAQEAALAAVRPGPTGREVDAVARAIIDAAGHAEHFGHGLGHGVGLEVHEGPRLSKQGETALAAGHGRHRRARGLRARAPSACASRTS